MNASSLAPGRSLSAQDVMVTRLVTLDSKADLLPAIHLLMKRKVTGAPVVNSQQVYCGVFSEKSCLSVALNLLCTQLEDIETMPTAANVMARKLQVLRVTDPVLDAIGQLVKHRVSGLPIVDDRGEFVGVFSEKTSMQAVLKSAFDQCPDGSVLTAADTDLGRLVIPATPLPEMVRMFIETPYRRLVVVDGQRVLGLVSRRDAIRAVLALVESRRIRLRDGRKVGNFMDAAARTIVPELDLLDVAQIFLHTNYRRLPVLSGRVLQGQLSRRDVLAAFYKSMAPHNSIPRPLLYLSQLRKQEDVPI